MKLSATTYLIFIFLKQFYIFSSGGIQPADIFLILSFLFYLISRDFKVKIHKYDRLLIIFTVCVTIINGFYFLMFQQLNFILPIFYFVFNLIVVILFRELLKENVFKEKLFKVIKANILLQLIIYVLGLGRWYGSIRYMGTFNDPNQMAFFLFISLLMMYVISKIINLRINPIYILIITFLIIETASTGMLLALVTLYLLFAIYSIPNILNFTLEKMVKIIIASIVIGIILNITSIDYRSMIEDSDVIPRVEEKIMKGFSPSNRNHSSYSDLSLIQERGIDKLILYPDKMLYGAGEGLYQRFSKAAHMGEIHSTLPSILFYYGVIPFLILMIWFKKNIVKINKHTIIVFIPLLIESFTLLNQRQPFFWMIFVLAYELNKKPIQVTKQLSDISKKNIDSEKL